MCVFYNSIINRRSVGFTKPMIDYEILADSQHLYRASDYNTVALVGLKFNGIANTIKIMSSRSVYLHTFPGQA